MQEYARVLVSFPLEVHQRPSNHATVQTILNTVDPLAVPPVCCVPNKLSSLGILYTNPAGVIVYKTYKKYDRGTLWLQLVGNINKESSITRARRKMTLSYIDKWTQLDCVTVAAEVYSGFLFCVRK